MTEREKIIELAEQQFSKVWVRMNIEHLDAFYHAAQADAFEQAHNAADNAYATDAVLNEIRQLGKDK